MTTSFTTSDEFEPQGGGFDEEPDYPEAFGITFTPTVTGIALGVGGLLISAYLAWSQVIPAWARLSDLNKQRAEKQEQLDGISSDQLQRKINEKKVELKKTQDLKADVINLFSSENNLETLLLDVNTFADLSNIKINSYAPTGDKETLTNDSLGSLATNNVQVKSYSLDLEGTFSQLQLFLQDLERLQPLLVVKNLEASTLEEPIYLFENDRLSTVGTPILQATMVVQAIFADVQPVVQETSEEENSES